MKVNNSIHNFSDHVEFKTTRDTKRYEKNFAILFDELKVTIKNFINLINKFKLQNKTRYTGKIQMF